MEANKPSHDTACLFFTLIVPGMKDLYKNLLTEHKKFAWKSNKVAKQDINLH
jgi:hypothetical protein